MSATAPIASPTSPAAAHPRAGTTAAVGLVRGRGARAALGILWMLGVLTAVGCASPPSSFYTLSGILASGARPPSGTRGVAVAVGPVSIPAEVDRPEIVVSEGPNRVRMDETNRWASPLADNIAGAVAENLAALLDTPRVTLFPQTASAQAAYRVAIEVQAFRSAPGNSATLDAVWTVRRTADDRTETGRTSLREPVAEPGYEAIAAAHSRALAGLSQDLADALRALGAGAR